MRRLVLGAATVAIAATAACSALGKQVFQQPVVRLKDVTVQGIGLTGGIGDAVASEQIDDVFHHRTVSDRHHRFGAIDRERL